MRKLGAPLCHPERKYEAKGLCASCYNNRRDRRYGTRYPLREKAAKKRYFEKDPRRKILHNVRSRACRDGMECSITLEDIKIPVLCPILGIVLSTETYGNGKPQDDSPSLDRIDNNKGYIPGNVAVISNRANLIKSFGTAVEHERIAVFIREHILSQVS